MRTHPFYALSGALWTSLVCLSGCNESAYTQSTSAGSYSLTGSVSVPASAVIDGDVNNTETTLRSNDSAVSAQTIPNPVLVGGYVNQPGAGPAGRSKTSGDVADFYRVALQTGQRIALFIGADDLNNNDLELLLLNESGLVVDASTGRNSLESLIAPADGGYLIQVRAFRGASNYVLSIGQALTTTAAEPRAPRLSDEFVAGELTVEWRPDAGLHPQSVASLAARLGLQTLGGTPDRRMLLSVDQNLPASRALAASIADELSFSDEAQRLKYATLQAVKTLQNRDEVADASPNYVFKSLALPNDPLYRYQWHYSLINLPQAWNLTTGNSNVVVAVIDTGVLINHPDLQGKIVSGYDFIRDPKVGLDGNGLDSNPDDPGDSPGLATGSSFHGTHVAGTLGAVSNNGEGVAGIGWNTSIMALRVLGKGGNGTDYDIEQALRYAAGLSNDSGTVPSKRADVINFSLGGPNISSGFQSLVNSARNAGSVIVAAAGNDGNNTVVYPGGLSGVISVAAVDINRERASYSNSNATVDIAAPGGNNQDINGDGVIDAVVSTLGDDSQGSIRAIYAPSFGTSMAAPHVAGVIALMKAVNPKLTPADVDNLLMNQQLSDDLGSTGRDNQFGYGLLNAHSAVLAAMNLSGNSSAQPSPVLGVSPAALNFGSSNNSLMLNLSNLGGGALRFISSSETSGGRLRLTAVATGSDGLGSYSLSLNRNGQNAGTYSATLELLSNTNRVKIPVIWQVSSVSNSGNAGRQFILLVNPDTLESVREVQAEAVNGRYPFNFLNVPAGTYILITGSDNNNDKYICDSGEACGAYPLLSQSQRITVDRSLSNVTFDVNFNTDFLAGAASLAVDKGDHSLAAPLPQGVRRPGQERQVSE